MENLPFYPHPGEGRCFQASLKSVLKSLRPEKDYDYDELDEISGRPSGNFGTWPVKPAIELSKMGFYVKYYSGVDAHRFITEGILYLREILPSDVISRIHLGSFNEARRLAPEMLRMSLFEQRKVHLNFLLQELEKDRYPILMITTAPFTGKLDNFGEHYVVMLGLGSEYIDIQDSADICSGIKINTGGVRVPLTLFNQAFHPNLSLNEAFIIGNK